MKCHILFSKNYKKNISKFSKCHLLNFLPMMQSVKLLTNQFREKKSFRNTIRVSNSLDPDQARCSVGPDLGPNCLQSYQQMTKVASSGEKVS